LGWLGLKKDTPVRNRIPHFLDRINGIFRINRIFPANYLAWFAKRALGRAGPDVENHAARGKLRAKSC
jgi:hypothetical protein